MASTGTPLKGTHNLGFLTPDTKLTFSWLVQIFTEVSILDHFDLDCHIWIENDASCYAIIRVISPLTPDSGEYHSIAFVSRKIIPANTRYKTHD